MKTDKEVEKLIIETREIVSNAENSFARLSNQQLNWKPAAERWSVAQCFEHLLTTNNAYFPTFDALERGEKKTRMVERLPVFPAIWGTLLRRSLDPKSTRKLKAPSKVNPTSSNLGSSVISDFIDQQQKIVRYMTSFRNMELTRIIVTSPFLSLLTFSLMDALRIIVVHEQRHLIQAANVVAEEGFPHA